MTWQGYYISPGNIRLWGASIENIFEIIAGPQATSTCTCGSVSSLNVTHCQDFSQAGLLEDETQGGDSPGLPAGRPNVSQQQLETMLSMHGLRDEASDD